MATREPKTGADKRVGRPSKADARAKRAAANPVVSMDDTFDIYSNKFGRYVIPKAYHMRVLPKILAQGLVYERRTIQYICDNAGDGDVITGGAFIGDFLPAISAAMAPGALIHTFEPNPLCHEACRRTIEINGLTNVRLHQVAVGHKTATMALRVEDFEKGEPAAAQSALNNRAKTDDPGYTAVDVVRLDDLIDPARKITVLHLDIEGFEQNALRGAAAIVRRNHPKLVIEGRKTTEAWLAKAFPKQGYTRFGAWEKNQIFSTDVPAGQAAPGTGRVRVKDEEPKRKGGLLKRIKRALGLGGKARAPGHGGGRPAGGRPAGERKGASRPKGERG